MQNILHYRVVRKLGSGGMGEVWLVEDENIGRLMAFKMITPAMSSDPQLVDRFKQEARLQASLSHSNIVTLHTFFQHEAHYIIGMEYAPGITLKELIARTGPIHAKRAVHIFRQICMALQHSHQKNIIHRDIKPANVMVDIDNDDHVKVMDFGIAKAASGPGLTRTGFQIGTPAYMSPEQIKGLKSIDQRTDIYSLGITLYHMLCGRPPFDEDSMSDFDLRNAVVNDPLPDPLRFYPNIPLWLKDLVFQMCAKDPADRTASMQDVLQLLDSSLIPKPAHPLPGAPQAVVTEAETVSSQQPIPIHKPAVQTEPKDNKEESSPAPKKTQAAISIGIIALMVFITMLIVLLNREPREPDSEFIRSEGYIESEPGGYAANEPVRPVDSVTIDMVNIPGGNIQMGRHGKFDWEKPSHPAYVSSFQISRYEISNRQWQHYMSTMPSTYQEANLPVQNVSWLDAVKFCNALSEANNLQSCYNIEGNQVTWDKSANGFRLPTEAEWEYAASGGQSGAGFRYSGSDRLDEVAWHSGNTSGGPALPGNKQANEMGLYDMSGNMWEWCWDWSENYRRGMTKNDYSGPGYGTKKVMRGGSWNNKGVDYAGVSYRNIFNVPEYTSSSTGLRVVRSR